MGTGDAMTSSASADSQRLVVTLVTTPAFPAVARFALPPRIPWVIERTPDAMRCCHTLLRGWAHGKVQPCSPPPEGPPPAGRQASARAAAGGGGGGTAPRAARSARRRLSAAGLRRLVQRHPDRGRGAGAADAAATAAEAAFRGTVSLPCGR